MPFGKTVLHFNGVPGPKTNPLGALVNIVCFNGQMATHCCYPIKALFTFNSIGIGRRSPHACGAPCSAYLVYRVTPALRLVDAIARVALVA